MPSWSATRILEPMKTSSTANAYFPDLTLLTVKHPQI